jgi:hypothetical protein
MLNEIDTFHYFPSRVTLASHAFTLLQREAPSVEHDEAMPARAIRSDSEGSSDTGFRRKRRPGRAACSFIRLLTLTLKPLVNVSSDFGGDQMTPLESDYAAVAAGATVAGGTVFQLPTALQPERRRRNRRR